MGTNGNGQFLESELIHRKVKVGTEWQTRTFPIVGGRLRILHENNDKLSIRTEIIRLDNDYAVVKAAVENQKGKFDGTGTASVQRDAKLADSIVELAETRAIARALRFGGIGVEYTGAEEVSHVASTESEPEQTAGKESKPVFPDNNGNGKTEAQGCAAGKPESKPSSDGNGNGRSTQAQCRALYALTKKARYGGEDIANLLRPMNAPTFEDLTREDASRLISYLQTQTAQ
ncbi:MAG: hypothetical protein ACLQPD_25690 [Desulfomonilaceae bacterium]